MAPKPPCGNPLFLEWLTEIYESLRSSDARSTQTYKKACDSLRSCPIKYVRPAELIHLRGIGPGMVKQLEKRQKEYYEGQGLDVPEVPLQPANTRHGGNSGLKRKPNPAQADSSDSHAEPDDLELEDFVVELGPGPSVKAGPSRKKLKSTVAAANKLTHFKASSKSVTIKANKKMYIPKIRSGAFAILLALLLRLPLEAQRVPIHPDDGGLEDVVDLRDGWMTKSEVVLEGQEYCDVSMTQSENGGHHNGYSAMSALTQKGLVHREGNPARFRLTELGLDTARAIRHLADIDPLPAIGGPSRLPASPPPLITSAQIGTPFPMSSPLSKKAHRDMADDILGSMLVAQASRRNEWHADGVDGNAESRTPRNGRRKSANASAGGANVRDLGKFVFWYIGALDKRVSNLELATCTMHLDLQLPVRKIEFPSRLVNHPEAAQVVNVKHKTDWVMVGWVLECDAQPTCPGFDEAMELSPSQSKNRHNTAARPDAVNLAAVSRVLSSPVGVTFAAAPNTAHSLRTPTDNSISPVTAQEQRNNPAQKSPRVASHSDVLATEQESEQHEVNRPNREVQSDFAIELAVKFPPGCYEIILLMDCRELHKKRDVDEMKKGLLDKGVKVEVRALRMGDVAWIARDTTGKHSGEEKEVVLDFVVERKRLDDLVGSIKDGRYDDQKLRLTNSCIRNVYYVIEDWDNERHRSENGQQIATSKSQTQVIDQCFVKDTHSLKETISFLKTMSDSIQELYEHETLYLIPSRYISRPTYVKLQHGLRNTYPTKYFVTSYETYQAINSKSGNCTLLETFARMLMCIRGMTHEKLCLVLDVWQTPLEMWRAVKYREAEIVVEREKELAMGPIKGKSKVRPIELFFADAIEGRSQRQKIGDALSREMYAVICA